MSFPTSITSFTSPSITDYLNSPSHVTQHSTVNVDLGAVETKLGTGASTPAANKVLRATGAGTSAWGAIVNANVDAAAAIDYSKLALTGAVLDADLAGSIAAAKITNTAVTLSDTQTLTNKTLTSPVINTPTGDVVTLTGTQTQTNKTLTTPIVASFYQDAGKTKLMTTPDTASDTLCAIAATQTLTNKTLTSPTLTKPTVNGSIGAYTTDSDAATVTFNMAASNVHTVVLGGNRTLAVSNTSVGQPFILRLVQDGTGSRTVTWFSTLKWAGGTAPTLTTTASKTDVFGFLCTSANNYDAYIVGQNL